jgi:DICT domain-containing protein
MIKPRFGGVFLLGRGNVMRDVKLKTWTLPVGLVKYTIVSVPAPYSPRSRSLIDIKIKTERAREGWKFGECDVAQRQITLFEEHIQDEERYVDTLCHEIAHAILAEAGLDWEHEPTVQGVSVVMRTILVGFLTRAKILPWRK